LMPSTRFGYLLYPIALLAWVRALREATRPIEILLARPGADYVPELPPWVISASWFPDAFAVPSSTWVIGAAWSEDE